MLELGPITTEYLANPIPADSFKSANGYFFKHIIKEMREDAVYTDRSKGKPVFFTMRGYEHQGLVSLKQIYMNSVDEYECAMKAFGSWDHWLFLCKIHKFLHGRGTMHVLWSGVLGWREEKRLQEQQTAKKVLMDLSAKGNFAASKMLYELTATKEDVGRPSKEKVLAKITEEVEKDTQVAADFKRIRMAVNNDKRLKVNSTK